jgi:1-phosphatidylinositol-4-phosphate 5-kinase
VQRADPQTLSNGQLPQKDQSERKYFVFYQDEGGIRATDEYDRNEKKIYYLGVIDILTPYNWKKKIEHCWRSMQYDKVGFWTHNILKL